MRGSCLGLQMAHLPKGLVHLLYPSLLSLFGTAFLSPWRSPPFPHALLVTNHWADSASTQ